MIADMITYGIILLVIGLIVWAVGRGTGTPVAVTVGWVIAAIGLILLVVGLILLLIPTGGHVDVNSMRTLVGV